MREEGATVHLVGTGNATAEYKSKHGYPAKPDITADKVDAGDFDGLVIPGGWAPDRLRQYESVLRLVRDMNAANKPIACICHGGWVLASADVVRGRNLTSYVAIKDDLLHAGALWQDAEVVVDGNLVTARKPDDLPAFMREFLRLFDVTTQDAADALRHYALLLELLGEDAFRSRTYENAARQLEAQGEPLDELIATGRLASIKGIGKSLSAAIIELAATGTFAELDDRPRAGPRRRHRTFCVSTASVLKRPASFGGRPASIR